MEIGARREITSRRVIAIVANLARHIAQREAETAAELLNSWPESHSIESTRGSEGPGNVVMVQIESVDIGGLPVTARTNAEVIEQFLPVGFRIEEQDGFAKVGVRH